jgi:hypothetical protein
LHLVAAGRARAQNKFGSMLAVAVKRNVVGMPAHAAGGAFHFRTEVDDHERA